MNKKIKVKITPKQQSKPEENPIDDKNLEDIIQRFVVECVGLLNSEIGHQIKAAMEENKRLKEENQQLKISVEFYKNLSVIATASSALRTGYPLQSYQSYQLQNSCTNRIITG